MLLSIREAGSIPHLPKTFITANMGTLIMLGSLPRTSTAEFAPALSALLERRLSTFFGYLGSDGIQVVVFFYRYYQHQFF